MPKVIYLSGGMTGIPEHNYPEFHRVANILRKKGYIVFSPAETNGGEYSLEMRPRLLRVDTHYILSADMVCVMAKTWANSPGSRYEALVALTCGIPVWIIDEDGLPIDQVVEGEIGTVITKEVAP